MEFQLINGFDMGDYSGIANPRFEYVDDGSGTGKRKLSETQSVDSATGLPLWDLIMNKNVEDSRGRQDSIKLEVTIPSKERPELRRGRPVEFSELWVRVTSRKDSYDVNCKFRASGFSQAASQATRPAQSVKEQG
jgi:hypothetical protein